MFYFFWNVIKKHTQYKLKSQKCIFNAKNVTDCSTIKKKSLIALVPPFRHILCVSPRSSTLVYYYVCVYCTIYISLPWYHYYDVFFCIFIRYFYFLFLYRYYVYTRETRISYKYRGLRAKMFYRGILKLFRRAFFNLNRPWLNIDFDSLLLIE